MGGTSVLAIELFVELCVFTDLTEAEAAFDENEFSCQGQEATWGLGLSQLEEMYVLPSNFVFLIIFCHHRFLKLV